MLQIGVKTPITFLFFLKNFCFYNFPLSNFSISTYNKQVHLFCVLLYAIDKIYINNKLWDVINEFK